MTSSAATGRARSILAPIVPRSKSIGDGSVANCFSRNTCPDRARASKDAPLCCTAEARSNILTKWDPLPIKSQHFRKRMMLPCRHHQFHIPTASTLNISRSSSSGMVNPSRRSPVWKLRKLMRSSWLPAWCRHGRTRTALLGVGHAATDGRSGLSRCLELREQQQQSL